MGISNLHAALRRLAAIGVTASVALVTTACTDRISADQRAALRAARQQDLPALDAADRVVIHREAWAGEKELTITNAADLKRLRSALVLRATEPSGGEVWATLTWLKGGETIRRAWVFDYGEWGFLGSNQWTMGRNEEIAAIIKNRLSATE